MTISADLTPVPAPTTPSSHEEELAPVFLLADTDPAAMQAMNRDLVAAFRACDGRLDGAFEGVPLLLLTTIGRRSGTPHTTPVNFTPTATGYVVIASKSGAPTHPDWFHNLVANPTATVELPGTTVSVRARTAHGAERTRLLAQHAITLPLVAAYQRRTTRQLPVLVLEPVR